MENTIIIIMERRRLKRNDDTPKWTSEKKIINIFAFFYFLWF